MRGPLVACVALAAALSLLPARAALAQLPVCAPPAPGEALVVSCRIFSMFPATRFLSDFTVDALFKPSPPHFQRTILAPVQIFALAELNANSELSRFLAGLAPLNFAQLDRTTGTVAADFAPESRVFRTKLKGVTGEPELGLQLPARLSGGYWRGPDALQVAFWQGGRVAFELGGAGGEIECVSLSTDGLLARFTNVTQPPLLVTIRECPK